MKEETHPYDSFCMEEQCFNSNKAFFRFHEETFHVANHHNVKSIHPVTFLTYFNKLTSTKQSRGSRDYSSLIPFLQGVIERTVLQVSTFLHQHLFDFCIKEVETTIKKDQIQSLQQFTFKMSEGNYKLLKEFKESEKSQDYFLKTSADKQDQTLLKTIQQRLEKKKQEIFKHLAIFFQDRKQSQPVQSLNPRPASANLIQNRVQRLKQSNFYTLDPKTSLKQSIVSKREEPRISRKQSYSEQHQMPMKFEIADNKQEKQQFSLVKLQHQNQERQINYASYSIRKQDLSDEQEQSQSPQEKSFPNKTKLISKPSKTSKKRDLPKIIFPSKIYQISAKEIVIKQVCHTNNAFKILAQQYPVADSIHIFDLKMATRASIKKIFSVYPQLKRLTINCWFQTKVLQQISIEQWKRFEKVCLKWDLQNFQDEYFLQKYFPVKNKKYLELHSKLSKKIATEHLQKSLQNQHLWLIQDKQVEHFLSNRRQFHHITSLEVQQQLLKHPLYSNIRHLTHLQINGDSFYDNNKDYLKLITANNKPDLEITSLLMANQNIKSVMLNNIGCFNLKSNEKYPRIDHLYDLTFRQLSSLPNLISFSLIHEKECQLEASALNIQSLKHLQSLYLHNIVFSTKDGGDRQASTTFLSNFTNLRHLSLYQCSSIRSEQISVLQNSCLEKIEFLNLGKTKVDYRCLETIALMKKLLYFNIESTTIKGKELLLMFKQYYELHQQSHPLKYLNIATKMFKWKVKAFQIAKKLKKQQEQIQKMNFTQRTPQQMNQPDNHSNIPPAARNQNIKMESQADPHQQKVSPANPERNTENSLMLLYKKEDPDLNHISQEEKRLLEIYHCLFTAEDLTSMLKYVPQLEYLNISHLFELASIDLRNFQSLRYLYKDAYTSWSGQANQKVKICQQTEELKPSLF